MPRNSCDIYEELIVLRAQNGDARSLAALVDHWQPQLTRFALRLTANGDAVADVMQETWLAIVRGLKRLDDPARFRPWAYRIVANKCTDWIRRTSRHRAINRPLEFEPSVGDDKETNPENDASLIRRALAQLPAERRTILAMFYLDDLSIQEIAVTLSLPAGTVKSRLFHARQQLKLVLERGKA